MWTRARRVLKAMRPRTHRRRAVHAQVENTKIKTLHKYTIAKNVLQAMPRQMMRRHAVHAQLERTKMKTMQQRTVASSVIWVPRPDKQALEQRHVQRVQLVDIQIKTQMWSRARFVILARRLDEDILCLEIISNLTYA